MFKFERKEFLMLLVLHVKICVIKSMNVSVKIVVMLVFFFFSFFVLVEASSSVIYLLTHPDHRMFYTIIYDN